MSTPLIWIALFLFWGFHRGGKLLSRFGKSFLDCPACRHPVRKGQIVCHHCLHRIKPGMRVQAERVSANG